MTTEAQIIANRLNAAKSTGPISPQGKAVASQNSLKHGLTSVNDVIRIESLPEYVSFRDAMLTELAPEGLVESILANRIISLSWRLKRTGLVQTKTIDYFNRNTLTENAWSHLTKREQKYESDKNPFLALGRMVVKDFSDTKVLQNLYIYEQRIENSLYKAILEFQKLKLIKTKKAQLNET